MKSLTRIIFVLLFVGTIFGASEQKKIEKFFPVKPNQLIVIKNLPSMNVVVKSWDRNEVKFNLDLSINSSDDDYEKEFIDKFDLVARSSSSELVIEAVQPENGTWSFWDIFELKFSYYVEKQFRGEIYIPSNNPLYAEISYSDFDLSGMKGELELEGRSNDLLLKDCVNIRKISNQYGNVTITKSGGNLLLESRSSTIKIFGFDGPVKIDAPYSNVELYDISKSADVSTRSASVKAERINGDLKLDAPYCTVEIDGVKGIVNAADRSGKLKINDVLGLALDIPYSNLIVTDIEIKKIVPIRIDSRSENLHFTNVKGNLDITDNYSNFTFENITGDLKLSSRSGNIEMYDLKGKLNIETQYSTIKMRKVTSDEIIITNRSNPITLELVNVPKKIDITNEYGDVEISMPQGFSGDVELSVLSGEIDCDFPLKMKTEGNNIKAYGTVGSGNGKIKINVRSGHIKVKEN